MELANIIINSVIAVGTIVAIFIAWHSANKNTQKQIYNSNKQLNRPYLSITNCCIVNSKTVGFRLPVLFDEYFKADLENKLEEKKYVKKGVFVSITFKNNGYGVARLVKAFDVRKEFAIFYEEKVAEEKIVMHDDYYLDIAVGEEKQIFMEVNYIREKPIHSMIEKPISDQCELAFFYKDLNDNFYSNDIVFNILYNYEKSEEKNNEIYNLEYSQQNIFDHYYGSCYITNDRGSHFSNWLRKFSKGKLKKKKIKL